jgi:hypothetical protein
MSELRPLQLKPILILDAVTCVAMGLLLTLLPDVLSPITGIPRDVLLYSGLVLFPIAALMATVASRYTQSSAVVVIIVAGNVLWVIASVWLMLSPAIQLTVIGQVFIAAQGFVVAAFAVVEYRTSQSAAGILTGART